MEFSRFRYVSVALRPKAPHDKRKYYLIVSSVIYRTL